MFTTERLRLRAYETADLPELRKIVNDTRVLPMMSDQYTVPKGPKFVEELEKMAAGFTLFCIIETKSDPAKLVGLTNLECHNPKNREGIFGIMLRPEYWGVGYGTEVTRFIVDYAFHSMNMHRVSLGVYEANERAISLYKKMYVAFLWFL
jgi:RimJ/RimL family protein N-acetyltransferase